MKPLQRFMRLWRDAEFRAGARDMSSVAPGLASWGLMTGVAMANSGMSTLEVLLMGVLVYAGSSQLAALPLIAAGAPLWVVLATAFCVNLRFVVFSAHLRDYMMHLSLPQRLWRGYLTTDLTYVLFVQRHPKPGENAAEHQQQMNYLLGSCALGWVSWTTLSLVGIAFAHAIPQAWGLGFAGILALMGILCSLVSTRLRALSAVVAGTAAVAAFALPLKLNILVGIAAAVCVCMLLEKTASAAPGTNEKA